MSTIPNNLPSEIDPELFKKILSDRRVLTDITRKSILYFFYVYFGSYIKYPIAPFHLKMFKLAQDDNLKRAGVVAFRGSAKSTILNTAYALWAVMGVHKKKHIVIASQTQQRAKDHLKNIRKEIEQNQLLRQNLGPFQEMEDQWHATALVIPRYQARITAISIEEGIRGLREGPNRPDLLLIDDIEDTSLVKTKENRDKIFNWLTGELLPIGDMNTKAVFIGNFLHESSALMRIEAMIKEGKMLGEFIRVPIVDENENIAWPGMFPTMESIDKFRQSIGNDVSWHREYLLRYVPEADQIIKPEDIHYYDVIPTQNYWEDGKFIEVSHGIRGVGIDLAISQKETADYTSIVQGQVVFYIHSQFKRDSRIYIDPHIINERLGFHDTIQRVRAINEATNKSKTYFVEAVGYQQAAIEEMQRQHFHVKPMHPGGDKTSRLQVIATHIKSGRVVFPRKGCEQLIQQLVYFGLESHDDLVDALAYLILGLIEHGTNWPQVIWI